MSAEQEEQLRAILEDAEVDQPTMLSAVFELIRQRDALKERVRYLERKLARSMQ